MHCNQCIEAGGNIVDDNSGSLWKRLQLPHRRWLQNIESAKENKAREKRFPSEGYGDQRHKLASNFVDHHELRILFSVAARHLRGGGYADQRDEYGQRDGRGSSEWNGERT